MIRRIVMYLILISFFLGGYMVMSMIPTIEKKPADPAVETKQEVLKRIRVMTVSPRPFQETITIPGTTEAYYDLELSPAIPGTMEKVYVKEGDFVKKGQTLFLIDLRSRQAMLQEAKSGHDLAVKTLARTESLYRKGNSSVQDYDQAQATETQTAATMKRLEVDISLGTMYAPQDGFIDKVSIDEGEFARDGVPIIKLLVIDPIKISAGIPEKYIDSLAKEKEALVLLESLHDKRPGKVLRLAYGADTQTNTYEAKLTVDNKDFRIRPGMIVRVQFVTKRVADALLVPLFSLVKGEKSMSVFVEKDGKVEQREIQLGGINGDFAQIAKGIAPNENIVVVGQKDLTGQEKVQVMERITELPASLTPEVISK